LGKWKKHKIEQLNTTVEMEFQRNQYNRLGASCDCNSLFCVNQLVIESNTVNSLNVPVVLCCEQDIPQNISSTTFLIWDTHIVQIQKRLDFISNNLTLKIYESKVFLQDFNAPWKHVSGFCMTL
jgi:hypothetical protein